MKLHKPIRWKEGLFLKPQHFQQFDLFLEAREFARSRAVTPHAWGLTRLVLDEEALSTFVFQVEKLQAVFPDGTLVDAPVNARVDSRPFEKLMTEVGRPLQVTLGIRALEGNGPYTLSRPDATSDARHFSAEEECYDLDAGRDPFPLERLVYHLRVFMGDEPTDGYSTLPLARLVRTGDVGRPVEHDPQFAPPALSLAASDVLYKAARAVVERLTVVLRDLGQQRGGNDPDPLILYYGLSGSLPVLREMVQKGEVHPRQLYFELARLAGALFYRDKQGRNAEEIPVYDHAQPAPTFLRLRDLIAELSEIVIRRAYRRCPMEREGDLFSVALPQEAKQSGARFFLEVESAESKDRVPLLVMAAKISHPGRIEHLRKHALPGVPTEAQPGPPPELPVGQKGAYFRLKYEETEWTTHVVPSGELAAFILNAPKDVRVNLIVVLPG